MSATSGTQASTNKGETTSSSSKSSKSGYDHLDINKLYKGKTTETVAKTVTQKHGMQALGKALPARRGGSTVVKAEATSAGSNNNSSNSNDHSNSSSGGPPSQSKLPPPHNLGPAPGQPGPPPHSQQQYPHHHHHQQAPPGWQQQQQQNSSKSFPQSGGGPQPRPPATASPHHPHHPHHHPLHNSSSNAPNAPKTGGGGPPGSMHDKNWSGGPPPDMLSRQPPGPPGRDNKNFPPVSSMAAQESMQRFAQEFPSLDSGGGDGGKGAANAMSKNNQDNQYGPGPILRPQTEGSWTQGGGRGMPRPPGPPPPSSAAPVSSSSTREFGPGGDRPNMGGPTPPPMSLGQGGHPPPPLGAFPMQFPPRAPYMYPNSGPGGPPGGPGFYPPGPGMPNPRFGMQIPPGAPPPSSHPQDGGPPGEGGPPPRRGRGPPPNQMRSASHAFASKPIIKAEELERMDELGQQDGGWATNQDDVDYNKKISFSDDEGQGGGGDKENRSSGRRQLDGRGGDREDRGDRERITPRESRGDRDFREEERDSRQQQQQSRPMKILERPQPMNDPRGGDRERDRDGRGDPRDRYGDPSERDGPPSGGRFQNDYNDGGEQEDWKRKPTSGFDRDGGRGGPLSQQNRAGRMNRGPPPRDQEEESWRSGSNNNNRGGNFEEDPRKKASQRGQDGGPLSGRGGDRGERERGGPPSNNERGSGGSGGNQQESGSGSRRGAPERGANEGPSAGGQQRSVGGGGGGAGDFGPASGPFQSNLPPRLQRGYHPNAMFSQQQERNSQRKTPSPVPSGNAVNKDRDFRDRDWDRNDRNDRDREPQRPTYKILERNRGDSESSKDSTSHRGDRGSRFVGGSGPNNDVDTVPVRLHRDSKDSTKRLSSDSGRLLLNDDDSKMSPKQRDDLDSMDSSYDSLRGSNNKQDGGLDGSNNKGGFSRSARAPQGTSFTSSWADEVADDQDYNSSDMDTSSRKGSLIRDLKRGDHQIHPEERRPPPREMPRRVIIQQTKVENMKSDLPPASKPEPPVPEVKQPVEPVKVEKPIVEVKSKSFPAWGDRDSLRDKAKLGGDGHENSSKDGSVSKEGSERDSHSSEKESGKGQEKGDHGKMEENDKGHGQGSREKLDGRERDNRHYDNNRYGGSRYEKGGSRDIRLDRDQRDNRQKPRRMDSYEQNKQSRDNRTPDRDRSEFGGRSSQEKDGREGKGVEKTKSGDRLDKEKDKGDKEDYREERRGDRDDFERGHRGAGRGGKERGGYGVYQPRGGSHSERDRGGWGRDDRDKGRSGRGGGRGSGRDFYDKPSTGRGGRMEGERERGDKEEGHHHQQREEKDSRKEKDTASDLSNKGSVEDLGREKGKGSGKEKGDQREQQDKGKKSPGSQRRNNNARGGARLQGYGPPSDKTPFSSGQGGHKDEQEGGDRKRDRDSGTEGRDREPQNSKPAPVPLMALGDISPPNMQSKGGRGGQGGRDLGERGGSGRGGRGMPQRMQRDEYSREGGGFRGAQQRDSERSRGKEGTRSGRGGGSGDAKPLMSINSNEVEGNEWDSGESVDSGEDDSKRSAGGSRKEGGGSSSGPQDSQNSQDGNKKKAVGKVASGPPQTQLSGDSSSSASNANSNKSSSNSTTSKDRRIKNPPYDPRPNSNKNQSSSGSNTWDNKMSVKENVGGQQPQQPIGTHSNNSTPALQESKEEKSGTSATNLAVGSSPGSAAVDNSGPLKTMIFENTNFKSINSSGAGQPPVSGKAVGGGKGTIGDGSAKKDVHVGSTGLGDLGGFSFGKVEDSSDIGFGTFNESSTGGGQSSAGSQSSSIPPPNVTSAGSASVPKPIGQPPRGYSSHQPSPISPQAADLNEKVQSVKRIWEPMPPVSSMPSVQEQTNSGPDHQDTSFHGGFGTDSFKGDNSGRDQFGTMSQGPPSGYAPGSSPALSAISKPESSSSPTSSNLRMSKQPQQQQVDSSGQVGGGQISSSPFGGFTMQPQGSNAFSGMPAVPSPPSVMYGASQSLHAAATTGPHSGIYQTFPDAHQVMNTAGRAGYGQFPTHPSAGSGQYGLFLSTAMEYPSMTSYQHQQSNQGQQGQGTSRISPGPMTTSGGGNSGVIISSASSLINAMKQQGQSGQSHPSMNPMSHNPQQGYSQMSHHHPAAIGSHPAHSHPQAPPPHHLGPVGPAKPPGGYSQQGGLGTPSQTPVFIPYHDPNQHQQSVINLGGQSFLSSAIGRGPPGGPPPPQTPPVQALQTASSYYSGSSGNQSGVFPGQGSNQGQSLQQLHVAVAPNPQTLQGYHSASQLGIQYPTQLNLQGFNQQAAASTVSALNLNSQIMRNPGPPQSHSAYMKQQPSMDLMGGGQLKSSHEQTLINQNTWNTAAYSINQAFHVAAAQQQQQQQQAGKAPGSNPTDSRGNPVGQGNAIGGQRKGNNIGGGGGGPPGGMKYMSAQGPGGYSGQVQQQ